MKKTLFVTLITLMACGEYGRGEVVTVGEQGAVRGDIISSTTSAIVSRQNSIANNDDVSSAPRKVRLVQFQEGFANNPVCVALPGGTPSGPMITVLNKSFRTLPTTNYIELAWSGQFTVRAGTGMAAGIMGRAYITSDGGTITYFRGLGDTFEPWIARRDTSGAGQQTYSTITTFVDAPPDTDVNVVVEVQSWDTEAVACMQNFVIRNN